jgi:hypothetical protein
MKLYICVFLAARVRDHLLFWTSFHVPGWRSRFPVDGKAAARRGLAAAAQPRPFISVSNDWIAAAKRNLTRRLYSDMAYA